MRYLKQRGNVWWYVRRVPKQLTHIFSGVHIQESLDTTNLQLAKVRRDQWSAKINAMCLDQGHVIAEKHQAERMAMTLRKAKEADPEAFLYAQEAFQGTQVEKVAYRIAEGNQAIPEAIQASFGITLGELMDKYKAHHSKFVGPAAIRLLTIAIRLWHEAGYQKTRADTIGRAMVADFATWLEGKERTKEDNRKTLNALERAYRHGLDLEILHGNNPFVKHKVTGKERKSYLNFTRDQWRRLLDESGRYRPLLEISLSLGVRCDEVATMRYQDFKQRKDGWWVLIKPDGGKTKKTTRWLPVTQRMLQFIDPAAQPEGYLFSSVFSKTTPDRYGPAYTNAFSSLKKRLFKGQPEGEDRQYCLHSARKDFSTRMERAGIPREMRSDLNGHARRGDSLTDNLYSEGMTDADYREALEKVSNYW